MMNKLNKIFSGITVIIAFWGLFWLLNGLDKFYNGTNQPNLAVTRGVIMAPGSDSEILYKMHPMEPMGWFGVNRDSKMVAYFNRLGIHENVALGSLYSIAILEILIGLGFLYSLFAGDKRYEIVRLTFKISMAIFFGFSIFDILCGDRTELWEHGTFLILATIHYVYILFAVPGKEFDQMRDKILSPSEVKIDP